MELEENKPTRIEKPKRKSKLSARKSRMLAVSQKWKPNASQKLSEAYSTKTEWARNLIPKLKKESEVAE